MQLRSLHVRPGAAPLGRRIARALAVASAGLLSAALISGCSSQALTHPGCGHRAKDGTLKASATHGKSLFVQQCATCHTLADANAQGSSGPDLDTLLPSDDDVCDVVRQGAGSMPADLVHGNDVQDVAKYVAQATQRDDKKAPTD